MIHLICTIITGYISYNWIEPKSFGSVIVFLIIWGLFEQVFAFLIGLIITLFIKNK